MLKLNRNVLIFSSVALLLGGLSLTAPAIATNRQANQIAQATDSPEGQCQEMHRGRGGHRGPDFTAAAARLGVSEAELRAALGIPDQPVTDENGQPVRPPRPDFAAAAEQLGVTEAELVEALGVPQHRGLNFAAAAAELGVSEQALKDALGVPDQLLTDENGQPIRPPRPDFAAAAVQLGVSEEALMNALDLRHRDGDRPEGQYRGGDRSNGQRGDRPANQ
jgi:hypothetical protein